MQLSITNLSASVLSLPYLEKAIPAHATIVFDCAQSDLSKMVDLQQAVADGRASWQATPSAIETASGILVTGTPASTDGAPGLQTARGKRIEQQSYENCKYQLKTTAIAGFNPAATSASDWDGATAGAQWTVDVAAHVRLLNQATGVIYTLTTETTCTSTGEPVLYGARLVITGSTGSPEYQQTAVSGTAVFSKQVPVDTTQQQLQALRDTVARLVQNTGLGKYATTEETKARAIPVANAIVIAPLTDTATNYGSQGGAFTLGNSPMLANHGLVTDGSSSYAWFSTGMTTDFTCSWRGRAEDVYTGNSLTIASAAPGAAGFKGWGLTAINVAGKIFALNATGVGNHNSSLASDNLWHTFTMKRSGTTVTLYIDGVSVATGTDGNTGGTGILIGYTENASSVLQYPVSCATMNLAMFSTALSDADRALVETWVSQVVTTRSIVPCKRNPIIPANGNDPSQTQEYFVFPDPLNPNQLLMFFTAFYSAPNKYRICLETAPVSDPTNWTNTGTTLLSFATYALMGGVVWADGKFWFYIDHDTLAGIDLYTSPDGRTLTLDSSSPVLTATGQGRNDGDGVTHMAVLYNAAGDWHAYYGHRGTAADGGVDLNTIRHATSVDGKNWTKDTVNAHPVTKLKNTPWSSYCEWQQIMKVGAKYVLVASVYDGRWWTECIFWSASPSGVFAPSKRNPVFDINENGRGKYVSCGSFFTVSGQSYFVYDESPSSNVVYSTNKWSTDIAQVFDDLANYLV